MTTVLSPFESPGICESAACQKKEEKEEAGGFLLTPLPRPEGGGGEGVISSALFLLPHSLHKHFIPRKIQKKKLGGESLRCAGGAMILTMDFCVFLIAVGRGWVRARFGVLRGG